MTTVWNLRKRGRAHVLDGTGVRGASLEFGRGMRTGTVTVAGTALPIVAHGPLRFVVTLGGDAPVLRLGPGESFVPGGPAAVHWRAERGGLRSGYHASLTRGDDRVGFALPGFGGSSVQVSVDGDWEQLELVALAGCFALLSQRRGAAYRTMAVVGAIGPHGR